MFESTETAAVVGLSEASPAFHGIAESTVALSGMYAQWLRGLTINAHERLAIAHLWKTGPMTMSELGARIPLSRAAITALTDRLEAVGYVLRTPDQQDRRRTVLSLTERPRELMEQMAGPFLREIAEHERSLSAEQIDAVTSFMSHVAQVADSHADKLRTRADDELPTPG